MEYKFQFCPNCKEKIIESNSSYKCNSCGMINYKNSSPTSSFVPIKDGKILLCIRAVDPMKGGLDTIGGFMENGEEPIEALFREVKEETGSNIKNYELVGTYIGEYKYQNINHKILNFNYVGELDNYDLTPQDDVADFKWFDLNDLPKNLAFPYMEKELKDIIEWYTKNKK